LGASRGSSRLILQLPKARPRERVHVIVVGCTTCVCRFAAMWHAPAFALSAILTLALGWGRIRAHFGASHAAALAPLPVIPRPARMVSL